MNILEKLRKSKNLSQQDMADLLNITSQGYGKIESGKTRLNEHSIIILTRFFGITADELLGLKKSSEIFDDARIPKTEVQELFDSLTPGQQERVLAYMHGFADGNEDRRQKEIQYRKNA